MPAILVLASGLLVPTGCGDGSVPAGESTSASPDGLGGPDAPLAWTADTVATLGGASATDWAAFREVTSLGFDGRGRLYVLDGPGRRVTVVDSAGGLVGLLGVSGEGPGEFRFPDGMGVGGDGTLWIHDAGHGALLRFDPAPLDLAPAGTAVADPPPLATFGEQFPLDEKGWIPSGPLRVQAGRVIFPARPRGGAASDLSAAEAAQRAGEAPRDRRAVVAFMVPDSLAVVYRGWAPPVPLGRSLTEEETGGFRVRLPPLVGFRPDLHVAALPGGGLAVADSTTWSVRILSGPAGAGESTPGGTPALRHTVLTRSVSPTPVDASVREAERARRIALLEADPPRMVVDRRDGGSAMAPNEPVLRLERARIDAMGFHDVVPVIRGLAADPEGRIWVQRHSGTPGRPGPVDVVTADGRYLGTLPPDGLRLPAAFGPGGLMATVSADEFGAPVLHILRLR